jgi:hypothetical protein
MDASQTLVTFKVLLESWKVPRDFPFQDPLYVPRSVSRNFPGELLKIAIEARVNGHFNDHTKEANSGLPKPLMKN